MKLNITVLPALVLLSTALAGCALDGIPAEERAPSEEPTSRESEALRFGGFSYTDPAVGLLTTSGVSCTATLIEPTVAITAAHCLGYKSGAMTGIFAVDVANAAGAVTRTRFAIDKGVSYGQAPGRIFDIGDLNDDVALVHLTAAVPASLATPFAISSGAVISMGTRTTIYGYGCRATPGDSYTLRKQRFDTSFDNTVLTCPGDSGGPTIMTMANGTRAISMVTSGSASWWPGVTIPSYGLVYDKISQIAAQRDSWAGRAPGTTPGGGGGGGGGPIPSPGGGKKLD